MRRLSRLSLPGYAVCAWLLFFPLLDVFALAIPPAPTQVEWRYSLTELLSRSLMTPMLGAFGMALLASYFEHAGVRRLVGLLASIGAVLLVALLAAFAVDSLGLRGAERAGLVPVFSGPWLAAFVKLLLATVVLGLVARSARGAPGGDAEPDEGQGAGRVRRPLAV